MFGHSITIFKMLGFEVRIDLSWIFIALLLTWSLAQGYFPTAFPQLPQTAYWLMGAAGALGLFISIILHELSHSVVARAHGIPIRGITLFIFGGVAEMTEEPGTPKSEFLMAVIGPVVSAALGLLFYATYGLGSSQGWPGPALGVLNYLGFINLLLAAFNLLPAFPLDGGRVFRSFLWSRKGDLRQATHTASRVGEYFGLLLIGLGILSLFMGNFIGGLWWLLLGMFLRNASRASFQQMQIRQLLQGEPIRRFMRKEPATVPADATVEEFVQDFVYVHHHQMFPVMADGHILGCVNTRQLKEISRNDWKILRVRDLVQHCSRENSVRPDQDAMEVLALMQRTGNSRLMVMEEDRLLGVITLKDLLRFLALKLDLEGLPLKE